MSKSNPILVPHMSERVYGNSLFYPNRQQQLEIAARTKPSSQSQLLRQAGGSGRVRLSPLETKQNNPVRSSQAVYPARKTGINFVPSEVIKSSGREEDERSSLNEAIVQGGFKVQQNRLNNHRRHVETTNLIR
jgi:hypothetical protein